METRTTHRPRQDSALTKLSRHCALSVHPEITSIVVLERHVVVVRSNSGVPADLRPQSRGQHPANLFCHCSPGCVGKTPGAGRVVKIFGTRIRVSVERAEPVIHGLCT